MPGELEALWEAASATASWGRDPLSETGRLPPMGDWGTAGVECSASPGTVDDAAGGEVAGMGAELSRAELSRAELSGAELSGAARAFESMLGGGHTRLQRLGRASVAEAVDGEGVEAREVAEHPLAREWLRSRSLAGEAPPRPLECVLATRGALATGAVMAPRLLRATASCTAFG